MKKQKLNLREKEFLKHLGNGKSMIEIEQEENLQNDNKFNKYYH